MQKWRKPVIRIAIVLGVVAVVAFGRYGTLAPCGMLLSAINWARPEPGPWTFRLMTQTDGAAERSAVWCLKSLWKLETEGVLPKPAAAPDKKSG
jgi:hypothetical protein